MLKIQLLTSKIIRSDDLKYYAEGYAYINRDTSLGSGYTQKGLLDGR